ncbi:hypothetical protein BDY19DRAFT_984870 [Irpex rosettiformis]|uniref:Uncharacterized protein n=1 Tax=Irpex rosettiformis TaxID=378272 RepID=A0ACB8U6U0_9APHY|nr:hypothetical protein BDY19DRAFT_984870 [Irpex rosettiformis]
MFARTSLVAFTIAAAISACQGFAVLSARDLPANCARTYTVVSGDFCDGISAKESVSTFQLALVNKAVIDAACDNLFVDEVICLGITGQDCDTVHVVQSGESCSGIAQTSGISFSTLLANNRNVNNDCSNIYPGEVLCTAPNVIPYSS